MSDRKIIRESDTLPPPAMHDWLEPMVDSAVASTIERLMEGRPPDIVSHKSRELLQAVIHNSVLSVLEQLVADGPPSEAEVLRLQLDEALKCLDFQKAQRAIVERERDEVREALRPFSGGQCPSRPPCGECAWCFADNVLAVGSRG